MLYAVPTLLTSYVNGNRVDVVRLLLVACIVAVKDTCLVLLWIGFAGGQLHGTGEYTNKMENEN